MTSWIVGVGAHGARLARSRAESDGRGLLVVDSVRDPRIDELARTADSILLMAPTLTHGDVVSVMERLASADRSGAPDEFGVGCPVGFLHAGSPEALDALDARQAAARAGSGEPPGQRLGDLMIDCTLAAAPPAPAPGLEILPYRGVTSAAVRERGALRLLAITAHGMGDLVHLDGDLICGRVREPVPDPSGLRMLPSCMSEPHTCVFKPGGDPIPAYEIEAEHVFVNACGTSRFDRAEFGPDYSLWYAMLEGGARSYVGSLRWKDGHGLEGLLYRHLLNAGHSLGTAVAVLNAVLFQHQIENGQVYCLLGDPLDRAADSAPPRTAGEILPGRNTLDLSHGYARFVLRDPALISAWREGKLILHSAGSAPVFFSTVPSPDGRSVHVFATAYGDLDAAVTVEALDYRPMAARVADIRESVSTTLNPALGVGGMYPNTARQGDRANLENRILNTARLFRKSRTEPAAVPKLLQNLGRLEKEVERLDEKTAKELLGRIRDTVYRFSEHYQDSFELAGVRDGGPCHLCGLRTVQRVQRSLVDPSSARLETICPGCGTLEDVPDDRLLLRLESASPVSREQSFPAVLTIANQCDVPVHAFCVAGVRRAEEYGATGPATRTAVTIPPGGKEVVEFPFRFARRTAPHQYDIQGAVVTTGRIYMARRPVGVNAFHV